MTTGFVQKKLESRSVREKKKVGAFCMLLRSTKDRGLRTRAFDNGRFSFVGFHRYTIINM